MDKATFSFDKSQFIHNDALYMISRVNEYVVAILNSAVGWWFLTHLCTDLQNGYLQTFKKDLFQIPVPQVPTEAKQEIASLVQRCLDARGEEVTDLELELDKLVGKLFELTPEDWEIINGSDR